MIPAEIRQRLGLEEGSVLSAKLDGTRIVLESPKAILERVRREFREGAGDRDLVAELIAEREAEARREEEDLEEFRRRL